MPERLPVRAEPPLFQRRALAVAGHAGVWACVLRAAPGVIGVGHASDFLVGQLAVDAVHQLRLVADGGGGVRPGLTFLGGRFGTITSPVRTGASTRREATIPITPSCQLSSATT